MCIMTRALCFALTFHNSEGLASSSHIAERANRKFCSWRSLPAPVATSVQKALYTVTTLIDTFCLAEA